jgi:repressor of nif and glnA expression
MPQVISPDAARRKDIRTKRKLMAILRAIHEAGRPLGGTRIASELQAGGIELSQRTVRHYLSQADEEGLTVNRGRRGRELTPKGEEELRTSLAVDKVGFIAAKVDGLSYRMTFRLPKATGKVILNVSTFDADKFERAVAEIRKVFAAGFGMGRYLTLAGPGAMLGEFRVPEDQVAVGTVCSVSLNGVLLKSGIAVTARFGGLLEISGGQPYRFVQIINYDGSTIDPLEIFIKGHMTAVRDACRTNHGFIGASFREVPAEALDDVRQLCAKIHKIGLGAPMIIGRPGQPLLDVPVHEGRVGMIVAGGLNPVAAVEESGIPTRNSALGTLMDWDELFEFTEIGKDPAKLLRTADTPEKRKPRGKASEDLLEGVPG